MGQPAKPFEESGQEQVAPYQPNLSSHVPALDGVRGLAILLVTTFRFSEGPGESTTLGEAFLRSLGFRQFRVRHHDRLARLEVALDEMPRLWADGRHEAIVARLRALGYVYVAVDLAGLQPGSANLLLTLGRKREPARPDHGADGR